MPWKPGQSGNPGGQNGADLAIRQLRLLEKSEVTLTFSRLIREHPAELKRIVRSPFSTIIEIGVATALMAWVDKGDAKYIELYMLYIFGKPKELEAPKDKPGQPMFDDLNNISDADLKARIAATMERLKKEMPKP
jgi:hypothetical protein